VEERQGEQFEGEKEGPKEVKEKDEQVAVPDFAADGFAARAAQQVKVGCALLRYASRSMSEECRKEGGKAHAPARQKSQRLRM
jgi:hypothetical protein